MITQYRNVRRSCSIVVGIIRLNQEEADRLPFKPAKLYGGKEGEYAGFLEV